MPCSEKHHAFISATFYKLLRDGNYPDFERAFLMAVRNYAEQRGKRMAQRAIRDGKPLNYAAYRFYSEWRPSEEAAAIPGIENVSVWTEGNDLYMKIPACPWSRQYLDMGLVEGANLYCCDLDPSIVRGFNPEMGYETRQTMHENQDFCLHVQKSGICEEDFGQPDPLNVKDFNYHCGHIFKTFSETMIALYKTDGVLLSAEVLSEFKKEYGKELADCLIDFRDINYNYI